MMYDVVLTGASFEAAVPSYIALLLRYALFLYKSTEAVVLGFYTDDDNDNAAVTVFQIEGEGDLKEASRKMYEFVKGRIKTYLRVLLPVESSFKRLHVYFNLHFKGDVATTTYSTLYPVNTVHDVAKIFFTIEDFEEWERILRSHALFSPADHLVEEYKTAFLEFRFADAFKCLLLLEVLDERPDEHLAHFLRVQYSQAESFHALALELAALRDLVKDLYRADLHRLATQKVVAKQIQGYFANVRAQVEVEIKDSHLTVIDGYQPRLLNYLQEIDGIF